MIKRTLRYLWGKKTLVLILVLVLLLLPNIIAHDLQVRTTRVITTMTIEVGDTLHITAEQLKPNPGGTTIDYETVTFDGDNIRAMLSDVSLAHCTAIEFVGDPDLAILHDLYNYQNLRANTKVNGDKTLDDWLRNHDYCYPRSAA